MEPKKDINDSGDASKGRDSSNSREHNYSRIQGKLTAGITSAISRVNKAARSSSSSPYADDGKYSFEVRVVDLDNGISYRVPESIRIAQGKETIKRELLQTKM
jgi:hypothetical protein